MHSSLTPKTAQRIAETSNCSTSYSLSIAFTHSKRSSTKHYAQLGGMWRRASLSLRRAGTGLWERGLNHSGGRELDQFISAGALRAFNKSAGGQLGDPQPANPNYRPVAATAANQKKPQTNSQSSTDIAAQRAAAEDYLFTLAKNRALPSLLQDQLTLRQFGIPFNELQAHLADPKNHGMSGIKAVKEMLFKEAPPQQQHPPAPAAAAGPYSRSGPQQKAPPPTSPVSTSPPTPSAPSLPRGAPATYSNGKSFVPKSVQPVQGANTAKTNGGATTAPPPSPPSGPPPSARVSIRDALNQQKIFLSNYAPGTYRAKCPKCNGGSKNEASFSITVDDDSKSAVWQCFRSTCGFSGSTHIEKPSAMVNSAGFFVSTTNRKRKEEPPVRPKPNLEPLTREMIEFFNNRGISESTLKRNRVSSELVYDPMKKEESRVIAFPYFRDEELINVKYRTLDKRFWQAKGAEKILYGLEDVVSQAEIIIVEGEMDKLALEEAGFKNVVSVPDGAPARVKDGDLPPASEDTKYSYLWNCRAWLDQAVRVVIATDNDAPGDALAEELARRLGRERCWRVRWPLIRRDHEFAARSAQVMLAPEEEFVQNIKEVEGQGEKMTSSSPSSSILKTEEGVVSPSSDSDEAANLSAASSSTPSSAPPSVDQRYYRKDANEVLLRDGDAILRAFVESAEPLPIRGLLRFHEYYDDVMKYYYLEHKDGQGVSTGWGTLDKYYKVIPGELTIVTGVPNSGKSEWIDALLCNLSEMHGWTFAMCSMEKRATDHARQLAEKYVGNPFFDLPYARGVRRMTLDELDSAMDWVDDRFHLIRYEDDQLPSVDWVLEIAKAAVYRYGIRGLVIDPYNELDHQRPASMNETEYVSQMLTKVKRFAQTAGVHVWFVAHPRQLREWKGQAPNLYDISGSAHFINKADNGIVVHRNRDPNAPSGHQVQILLRKVRNKAAGTMGDCILEYERINGRYLDPEGHSAVTPRTSQKVFWKDSERENNGEAYNGGGGGGQEVWQNGSAAYVHRDGTINRESEAFTLSLKIFSPMQKLYKLLAVVCILQAGSNVSAQSTFPFSEIYIPLKFDLSIGDAAQISTVEGNMTGFVAQTLAVEDSEFAPGISMANEGFVEARGSQFILNGNPWYCAGTNAYYAGLKYIMSDNEVSVMMEEHARRGATVLRVFAFSNFDSIPDTMMPDFGVYNEEAIRRLDLALVAAAENGIRLIMVMGNYWPFLGNFQDYVDRGLGPGNHYSLFYTDPTIRGYYKDWLRTIITRTNSITGQKYSEDPTVLSWELANEPRVGNNWERERGLEPGRLICDWVAEMSAYIKGLDSNHLVSVGDEGHRTNGSTAEPHSWINTGYEGVDFECNLAVPDIDFGTVHAYPDQWGIPVSGLEWMEENYFDDRAEIAKSLNKPLILEEYGMRARGYLPSRDPLFNFFHDSVNDAGYACTLVWAVSHYSPEAGTDDGLFGSNDGQGYVFGYDGDGSRSVLTQYQFQNSRNAGETQLVPLSLTPVPSPPLAPPPRYPDLTAQFARTPPSPSPVCKDVPFPGGIYTCAQKKRWGKCNKHWMTGYCQVTCGTCP